MFLDDNEKRKQISKWIIGIVTACILIFLGVRYIPAVAGAISWLFELTRPMLIGAVMALVLNVPLAFIERHLFRKYNTPKIQKLRRPLAILLSLLLVSGIFIGVAVLVIPELINAGTVISSAVIEVLDQIAALENSVDFEKIPLGEYLSGIDIDWLEIKNELELWIKQAGNTIIDKAGNLIGSVVSSVVDGVIGFVFSIYILANKETLLRQVKRLIRVWLPRRTGEIITHVASVCSDTFRLFIAGQTTEAIILGTLCTIGMLILRLPYAPMIGALVGVTALIPYVGAFIATVVGAFLILTVNPVKAVIFVIFLLALQQVEGNLIYPRVVGRKINLPSMWVLAAITVGGNLAGPIGMLLGVPTASATYALLKEATDAREKRKALRAVSEENA
ncbi:MAG: AI-2E family transporter [Oscillospiraceae bacterium]